jgi:hypothetical protein
LIAPLALLALGLRLILAALASPPTGRRAEQFFDSQLPGPLPIQGFERLGRVLDLIRVDDPVVVGIERLDHRGEPAMMSTLAPGRGSLRRAVLIASLAAFGALAALAALTTGGRPRRRAVLIAAL